MAIQRWAAGHARACRGAASTTVRPDVVKVFDNMLGFVQFTKFFGFQYYSTFVFIWQTLSNHKVTRFKRFVSRFTDKLCN